MAGTIKPSIGGTLLAAAALLTSACGSANYLRSTPLVGAPAPPVNAVSRHVVVVSIDGLRPDAISTFEAPTLARLAREGSFTMKASTIVPSKTLPSHTSMLTGEPPERHGVLWNNVVTADAEEIEQVTVFGVARSHGYATAAFFSKPKFQPLQQPDALDYSQAPGGWWGGWDSRRTVGDVETYLASAKPNLLFVHLADPDKAGHSSGWMSRAYGRAVVQADQSLGRLLAAADNAFGERGYTLILTADHGGHDYDHGSDDPRDVTIPWIAWGHGVRAGELEDVSVKTMDTASTVLWLLGLEEPTDWLGTPIVGAFTDAGTELAAR